MSAVATVDLWVDEWAKEANCAGQDPEALFVRGKAQHDAKAICKTCPVLAQCLAEALDSKTEFGVWGGMTERERRALLRKRPDITSWKSALRAGMAAQGSKPLGQFGAGGLALPHLNAPAGATTSAHKGNNRRPSVVGFFVVPLMNHA
ncbi:hypothetical protein GCM10009740_35030 [Terrabacter terrae]|uniref:Transcriptional regulator WhiB n=1 Tax=Terrabacter terrae TaxID=318434 RepID=A0ABP5G522_9MICO